MFLIFTSICDCLRNRNGITLHLDEIDVNFLPSAKRQKRFNRKQAMRTIKLFSESGNHRKQRSFSKLKVSNQHLQLAILMFLLLNLAVQVQAQRFWLTTYEFPYGPKTGITLTKSNCLFVGLTNGVIMSCDEGNHFDRVLKTSAILSIFSTKDGKVLAGGYGKIFHTDASGQNWDSISINSSYPVIQFAENSKGDLFAIASGYSDEEQIYTGDGVFISEDKGLTWVHRNTGLGAYKGCQKIAIDNIDRLYVTTADEYISGNGGLFISDNNGLLWKHIDINIDGQNTINDYLRVETNYGLSVSPNDSVFFSFSGISANVGVDINIRKSIYDIEKSNFWETFKVSNSNLWWNDKSLYNIHFAVNGDWYSSFRGNINSGATYYLKNGINSWTKIDYGLGLNELGLRSEQHFVEASGGKIFMVQWMDERIYWTDASITTSVEPKPGQSSKLRLFPNPVNRGGDLTVLSKWNDTNYTINIYDGVGRIVFSTTGNGDLLNIKAPLIPGFYHLELIGIHSRESARFVVN